MGYKKAGKKNYAKMAKKATAKATGKSLVVAQPKINPLLKNYVSRLIHGQEEVKFFTNSCGYKQSILGSGFNTTTSMGYTSPNNILPIIQQGVGQQQRIGNRITTKGYLHIRGHVLALPTSSTTNPNANLPFYVKIVVWRQKQSMTTVSNTQILDDGISGGGNDFDGTLDDLMVPFNKNRFEIGAVRTFMLQPNSTVGTYSSENLSKYPVSKFFRMNVKIPKVLDYNDTASDPSNCRWFFSAGVVNVDGSLMINTIARASITAEAVLKYRDA